MTELMGTQKPARRILDPDEAIAELERVVPGLVPHRRAEPAALDWAAAEDVLGTALPADFKRLCEWYPPSFDLDDFLALYLVDPGTEAAWAHGSRAEREWWDSEDAIGLRPAEPALGSLVEWGGSAEGDRFLWSFFAGQEHSLVTVCSRNGPWWHYEGGMVQFLAELCTGAVEPWALPPVRPEVT